MVVEKLDSIVCSALTSQSLPVHFYVKFLNYGVDCLRDLNMDVMRNVITKEITVNNYKAIELPCDFLDWVKVGIKVGQYVRPLPEKGKLNRLKNYNEKGHAVPYKNVVPKYFNDGHGSEGPYNSGYLNIENSKGEFKGGLFDYGGGPYRLSFKFIKERNEIQFDCEFPLDTIILEYISDGLDRCGCDTLIDPYAFDTIKNYMIWQYHLNTKRLFRMAPAWERQYINAYRKLRGRKFALTPQDVLMLVRKNTKATIKT